MHPQLAGVLLAGVLLWTAVREARVRPVARVRRRAAG